MFPCLKSIFYCSYISFYIQTFVIVVWLLKIGTRLHFTPKKPQKSVRWKKKKIETILFSSGLYLRAKSKCKTKRDYLGEMMA